jgi:O-antigen/teichoic acid export membrane protein
VVTDNIVHVAVFVGIFLGCYRASGNQLYVYVTPLALGGFAACLVAIYVAMQVGGQQAEEWWGKVDRATGRDFAYLLVLLALTNHLGFFAWGIAFGTYLFALILAYLTYRRWHRLQSSRNS